MEFYRRRGAKETMLFKVPSTVDISRFSDTFERPFQDKYICYTGSLTRLKDGVDVLIKSFSRISNKFPDVCLVLVGKSDTLDDEIYFRNLAVDQGISDRVRFTGKLQREKVPDYMRGAEVLALARPNSLVAEAGFPSKLTEYLAAGRPVVVTRVGEIPLYLTDNLNAFLSLPDSEEAFAERLEFVLSNPQIALEAGIKARELATRIFNHNFQAKRILEFISPNLGR